MVRELSKPADALQANTSAAPVQRQRLTASGVLLVNTVLKAPRKLCHVLEVIIVLQELMHRSHAKVATIVTKIRVIRWLRVRKISIVREAHLIL